MLTWESWKEPPVYFKMRHLNPMLYLILSFVTEWPKFSQERNEPKRTREVILRSPHHTTVAEELLDYLIKWLCVQCGGGRQSAVMKYLHSSNFGRTIKLGSTLLPYQLQLCSSCQSSKHALQCLDKTRARKIKGTLWLHVATIEYIAVKKECIKSTTVVNGKIEINGWPGLNRVC